MKTISTDIAQKIAIETRANNSMTIKLDIDKKDGSAFDLTGYNVYLDVENGNDKLLSLSNAIRAGYDQTAITTNTGASLLDDTGIIVIFAEATQMSLNPGTYKYKLTLESGSSVKTWMYGNFKVNKD
jgi:hypothetical protein